MSSILTPDQQQKLATLRGTRREGRGEFRGEKGERGGKGKLAEKLGLSADQKTKMQSIFQSNRQQMSAIRDNQSLSQQDKQAKMQQLHQSMKSQIDGVLTPDQQQKFAQMREHKGGRGHGRRGFGGGQNKTETPQTPGM